MSPHLKSILSKLIVLPIWDRLEIAEFLVSSVKADSPKEENRTPHLVADWEKYFGAITGKFGDALAYQKRIRDEWD